MNPEPPTPATLDEFAYHEFMDRISVIQETFHNAVMEHPVLLNHPAMRSLCDLVDSALSNCYREAFRMNMDIHS